MFASMLMLNRNFRRSYFAGVLRTKFVLCVYTEVMAQDNTVTFDKTTPHFQLLPMSEVDQS